MFISRDPIGLMGGDNVFAYAPNPTGWIDPLGLSCTNCSNQLDECGKNKEHLRRSCSQLLEEIKTFAFRDKHLSNNGGTHGLVHRFKEQINGASGPGTEGWATHEHQIRGQQKGLRCRLKAYEQNGCGDPPSGTWELATRSLPTVAEWKGNSATDSMSTAGKVAVGVGGGYIIYRGIRMLPSLLPPLWPTIPANAVIP